MNEVDQKIVLNFAAENDLSHIVERVDSESEALRGVRINGNLFINQHDAYFTLERIVELNRGWK